MSWSCVDRLSFLSKTISSRAVTLQLRLEAQVKEVAGCENSLEPMNFNLDQSWPRKRIVRFAVQVLKEIRGVSCT